MKSNSIQEGRLVVIEGVDGTGKTTIAKLVATRLGYTYVYCPPPIMAAIRREVEQLRDFNARFYYYLACGMVLQPALEELLREGQSVVVDRYIYSTFAMHRALGVQTGAVDMRSLPIRWPDKAFLLVANREVRQYRCSKRGDTQDYDKRIEQSEQLLERAQQIYMEYDDFTIIDTSERDVEFVYSRLLEELG